MRPKVVLNIWNYRYKSETDSVAFNSLRNIPHFPQQLHREYSLWVFFIIIIHSKILKQKLLLFNNSESLILIIQNVVFAEDTSIK